MGLEYRIRSLCEMDENLDGLKYSEIEIMKILSSENPLAEYRITAAWKQYRKDQGID